MRAASLAGIVAIASVLDLVSLSAQARPDFSGRWVLVSGADQTAAASSPLWRLGQIVMDASTLTFQKMNRTIRPDGSSAYSPVLSSVTFRLDGLDQRTSRPTDTGKIWTEVARAQWVSNALVITTKYDNGRGGQWEDLVVYSLAGNDTLNVVTVSAVLDGNSIMGTNLLVYKRAEP